MQKLCRNLCIAFLHHLLKKAADRGLGTLLYVLQGLTVSAWGSWRSFPLCPFVLHVLLERLHFSWPIQKLVGLS